MARSRLVHRRQYSHSGAAARVGGKETESVFRAAVANVHLALVPLALEDRRMAGFIESPWAAGLVCEEQPRSIGEPCGAQALIPDSTIWGHLRFVAASRKSRLSLNVVRKKLRRMVYGQCCSGKYDVSLLRRSQ
uniref:Uncharacterized protein n=1 Tax=Nelumbo nucifera TaxID=4432 RepID=A0A822Y9L8_NELNU|nr:TPA_asm: hypothetical protein HUJ06_030261 [Nelumbo nucifera]